MAVSKKPVEKILKAVQEARDKGIQIVRLPMFDWTGLSDKENRSLPKACDSTGAVLIQMGFGKSVFYDATYGSGESRPEGWIILVQKHLGVGVFWLWCWWNGWPL